MRTGGRPKDPGGELNKGLEKAGIYKGRPSCLICGKGITKDIKILPADATSPRRFYHSHCGPGSEAWLRKFPGQEVARILYFTEGRKADFDRYCAEKGMGAFSLTELTVSQLLKFFDWKEEDDMAKKATAKATGKGRGSGLKPKEAVEVPDELYAHPEVGKLLKELKGLKGDRGNKRAREIRMKLRKKELKLSDPSTWKKFLK